MENTTTTWNWWTPDLWTINSNTSCPVPHLSLKELLPNSFSICEGFRKTCLITSETNEYHRVYGVRIKQVTWKWPPKIPTWSDISCFGRKKTHMDKSLASDFLSSTLFNRKKTIEIKRRELVGGFFPPVWKNMMVKLDHFPRDESKKYLSCHHLGRDWNWISNANDTCCYINSIHWW